MVPRRQRGSGCERASLYWDASSEGATVTLPTALPARARREEQPLTPRHGRPLAAGGANEVYANEVYANERPREAAEPAAPRPALRPPPGDPPPARKSKQTDQRGSWSRGGVAGPVPGCGPSGHRLMSDCILSPLALGFCLQFPPVYLHLRSCHSLPPQENYSFLCQLNQGVWSTSAFQAGC